MKDDVFCRILDIIALYGPTELFNEIVVECLLPGKFGSACVQDCDGILCCGRIENFIKGNQS